MKGGPATKRPLPQEKNALYNRIHQAPENRAGCWTPRPNRKGKTMKIQLAKNDAELSAQMNAIVRDAGLKLSWEQVVAIANDETIAGKRENIAAHVVRAANRLRNGELGGVSLEVTTERTEALGTIAAIANLVLD